MKLSRIYFFRHQATDEDSGLNSAIIYSIVDGDPLNNFTINQDTGNITNTGPLDFETQSKFSLVIMAKDQGTPALNATKMVEITIMVSMKFGGDGDDGRVMMVLMVV